MTSAVWNRLPAELSITAAATGQVLGESSRCGALRGSLLAEHGLQVHQHGCRICPELLLPCRSLHKGWRGAAENMDCFFLVMWGDGGGRFLPRRQRPERPSDFSKVTQELFSDPGSKPRSTCLLCCPVTSRRNDHSLRGLQQQKCTFSWFWKSESWYQDASRATLPPKAPGVETSWSLPASGGHQRSWGGGGITLTSASVSAGPPPPLHPVFCRLLGHLSLELGVQVKTRMTSSQDPVSKSAETLFPSKITFAHWFGDLRHSLVLWRPLFNTCLIQACVPVRTHFSWEEGAIGLRGKLQCAGWGQGRGKTRNLL